MGQIELSYVLIEYNEPIVFYHYKGETELGFPEIKELTTCAETLSGGKPYLTFSDVRGDVKITPEGKRYLSDFKNLPLFRGAAALVDTKMKRVAANFFSHFEKKAYPFRAFTDQQKAIDWLRTLPLNK